jgi:GDP-4-dehydro-6-deoxy-D-mannose reductase
MTYLITGVNGFVGKYFLEYINKVEPEARIIGIGRAANHLLVNKLTNYEYHCLDLIDINKLRTLIANTQPDRLLHLASDSSVAYSWHHPIESFNNNLTIYLNVLESIKSISPNTRILHIGSSEEYGIVDKEDLPIKETTKLNPTSPYAAARVSQELMASIYKRAYNLDIVLTRSFNHIGYGQDDRFVVSSLIKKVYECANGIDNLTNKTVKVGNLSVVRDFLDVRDVVRAYHLLFIHGVKGEIYNICSGEGNSLYDIFKAITAKIDISVAHETDQTLLRPLENPIIIGCNDKLKNATAWHNKYSLDDTIVTMIDYWKKQLTPNFRDALIVPNV